MQSIHQDAENKCLGKTEQEKLCVVRKGKEKKEFEFFWPIQYVVSNLLATTVTQTYSTG